MSLTRRRWDLYFIPAIVLAVALAAILATVSREWKCLLAPFMLTGLWLWMRYSTPARGMRTSRIRASNGQIQLLMWLAFTGAIGITAVVADGRDNDEPPPVYVFVIVSLVLVIQFVGAWLIDNRYKTLRKRLPLFWRKRKAIQEESSKQ